MAERVHTFPANSAFFITRSESFLVIGEVYTLFRSTRGLAQVERNAMDYDIFGNILEFCRIYYIFDAV